MYNMKMKSPNKTKKKKDLFKTKRKREGINIVICTGNKITTKMANKKLDRSLPHTRLQWSSLKMPMM